MNGDGKRWLDDRTYEIGNDTPSARDAVIAILAAHDERTQNMEGDWICACGSFLCPPNDERLENCHREHIATIVVRRVVEPRVPSTSEGEGT